MSAVWHLPFRPSTGKTLRWYLAPGWRAHPWLFLGLLLSLAATGAARASEVWALKRMIDALTGAVAGEQGLTEALRWVAVIGAAHLCAHLMGALQTLWRSKLEFAIALDLRTRLLQTAAAAPLPVVEDPEFRDALQRAGEAGPALGSTLRLVLGAGGEIVTFCAFLSFVAAVHPALPLLIAVCVLPPVVLRWVTGVDYQTLLDARSTEHRRMDYLSSLLLHRGIFAEMRIFGFAGYLLRQWRALSDRLRRERLSRLSRHQLGTFLANFAVVAGVLAGFWLGVRSVMAGLVTFGAFVASMEALSRSSSQSQNLVNLFGLLQRDALKLANMYRVTAAAPAGVAVCRELAVEPHVAPGPIAEIRFENVSFTYPGAARPALRDVNLVLRAGKRVALVGVNGAGKSTLVAVLLGLYEPSAGRILIDGTDRRDLPPERKNALVSAVFQNVVQYPLTLKDQLEFFGPPRREEALRSALAAAGLSDWTGDWPSRLNQRLGKLFDGRELSGGQWQRVAIARALARQAPVLVVDEPTASLDPRAEVEVLQNCLEASEGRLLIMISHRLGICTLADRILVLEDGRIAEDGAHEELAKAGGAYARLWSAQAVWYR